MINTIKAKIKSVIEDITEVQEVNDYERVGFDGFPAVNITMAGNDSNFWSTATNQRAYNFIIRVFIPLKGSPYEGEFDNSKQLAEKTMSDVVDEILNTFDQSTEMNRTVDILRAAPSNWGYVETAEGWSRSADIRLQCVKFTSNR
jgi:hypothetical protein